jgi:hypothetical protein
MRTPLPVIQLSPCCEAGTTGRRAVEVATAALDEILSEWEAYLGTRNFTLLHQILDQLREITDPYAR